MGDSVTSPVRVSQYESPSWIFKCISWQYDRILDRYQFKRGWSWDFNNLICDVTNPSGNPPDIFVIQIRYKIEGLHVLPCIFWIRKDTVVGSELSSHNLELINYNLGNVFEQMNPEGSYVKFDMVQEVLDVARTLATMPRNASREGLSFVYEVNALRAYKAVIDSMPKVKFLGDASSETQICAICLDDISKGDEVIWMPCCHVYHGECILTWLEKKPKCPTCLMTLPMDR